MLCAQKNSGLRSPYEARVLEVSCLEMLASQLNCEQTVLLHLPS
jgi:hypothetical protein